MSSEISGIALSGLAIDSLSCVSHFLPDDALMVSTPALKHQPNPSQFVSKHARFATLSSELVSHVKSLLNFGSMAYAVSSDYAPVGHSHDGTYNKIAMSCILSNELSNESIATLTIDGDKHTICAPKPVVKQLPLPVIGQLKFVYQTSKQMINVDADDFDGWVYADGSSYSASKFNVGDAFDVVDGIFTVPALNNFIKMNPQPYLSNDMTEKHKPVVPPHSHKMSLSLSGNVEGNLKYKHTDGYDGRAWSHGVTYKDGTNTFKVKLDYSAMKISTTGYIEQSQQVGVETRPSYNSIPVMIYIGRPQGD